MKPSAGIDKSSIPALKNIVRIKQVALQCIQGIACYGKKQYSDTIIPKIKLYGEGDQICVAISRVQCEIVRFRNQKNEAQLRLVSLRSYMHTPPNACQLLKMESKWKESSFCKSKTTLTSHSEIMKSINCLAQAIHHKLLQ